MHNIFHNKEEQSTLAQRKRAEVPVEETWDMTTI